MHWNSSWYTSGDSAHLALAPPVHSMLPGIQICNYSYPVHETPTLLCFLFSVFTNQSLPCSWTIPPEPMKPQPHAGHTRGTQSLWDPAPRCPAAAAASLPSARPVLTAPTASPVPGESCGDSAELAAHSDRVPQNPAPCEKTVCYFKWSREIMTGQIICYYGAANANSALQAWGACAGWEYSKHRAQTHFDQTSEV